MNSAHSVKQIEHNISRFSAGPYTPTRTTEPSSSRKFEDASKIHTLYQDLYVNDLKREIEHLEADLKLQKEHYREA